MKPAIEAWIQFLEAKLDLLWARLGNTPSPPSGPAGGDLSGTYPNPTVAKIQTRAVSAVAPTAGQVLEFVSSAWTPTTLAANALDQAWTNVNHAASPFTAGAGVSKFAVDTSAGAVTIDLGTLADKQLFIVSMVAGFNPIVVVPPSGTIADPSNGNAQGATATMTIQGQTVIWQYDAAGTRLIALV